MPRRDGTGPMAMGPRTGWGRGYCRPRGFGIRRMNFGYGYCREMGRYGSWDYTISPEEEKALLENEKIFLQSRLKDVEERLEKLDQ